MDACSKLGFITDPQHDLKKLAIKLESLEMSTGIAFIFQGNGEDSKL